MAKKLFIIDGHAHIYAAYYAPMRQNLTSPAGEPTKAAYIFTNAILGLIQNYKPDLLAVVMDSKTPSFRTKIYSEYKAHRPPMPEDLPGQINRIEQILAAMNIPLMRLDGFEADDLIGTLSKKASAEALEVYICSKDKDMLQLLDSNVRTFDIATGKALTVQSLYDENKITPAQFIDVLALQGDKADNVPGIPDVGPKTALEWIQKYGSIDNLYKHADEIAGKRGDNLRKSFEQVKLSRELVTIDTNSPIEIELDALKLAQPDKEKLSAIFSELGFNSLLAQMGMSDQISSVPRQELKELAEQNQPQFQQTGNFSEPATAKTISHNYHLIDTAEKFESFLKELQSQKLFAVDTETTAINPMRAELVGLSFCWQESVAYYLPVKAPLGQKYLDLKVVRPQLAPIFANPDIKKIGQNIKYDMIVLRNAKLPLEGIYFDTMVASYCLDPLRNSNSMNSMALDFLNYNPITIDTLIGKGKNQLTFDMVDTQAACEYSAEDSDVTFKLYLYLKNRLDAEPDTKKLFETIEMPLVEVLAEMEFNGVFLDTHLLRNLSKDLNAELKSLTDKIYALAGVAFNIDSPKQLADILFGKLNLKPLQMGKEGPSTDAGVLEELSCQHPIIDFVLQYRQISKLENTYAGKLSTLINTRTNRVHASFNQTVTATGRLSSSDPNLQNIPIKTELGQKIRSAFIAQEQSDCILSADYSQVELRLLAYFSNDPALTEAFRADRDIHAFVASQIYNVPIEQVTSEMRSNCKTINFGIIYGQGAFGLSKTSGLSVGEAKKFIDEYFIRYSSIKKFMDKVIADTQRTGYAQTLLNRRRKILNITAKNMNKRSQAQRMAFNTVLQGTAADLIKAAMINIYKKIKKENLPIKMILQIHDELVFELPKEDAQFHAKWISQEMANALKLDVPLKVDTSISNSWLGK